MYRVYKLYKVWQVGGVERVVGMQGVWGFVWSNREASGNSTVWSLALVPQLDPKP